MGVDGYGYYVRTCEFCGTETRTDRQHFCKEMVLEDHSRMKTRTTIAGIYCEPNVDAPKDKIVIHPDLLRHIEHVFSIRKPITLFASELTTESRTQPKNGVSDEAPPE